MKLKTILTAVALLASLTNFAQAHDGRRLDIIVVDGQLAAQGYLSGVNPDDDGGGIVRPYFNAIHGHFNFPSIVAPELYFGDLPGFDLFDETAAVLNGADLRIDLLSASKWENPVVGNTPVLVGLDATEIIDVGFDTQPTINSNSLGSFTFATAITGAVPDIDLAYAIESNPANTLYALEWQLSTTQTGIADSESIYTILAPPGTGPVERLHFQSLALESALGVTSVPEPNSLLLLAITGSIGIARRRKR